MQARINRALDRKQAKGKHILPMPFPKGRFPIIYADPPWDYGAKLQYSRPNGNGEATAPATSAANWNYPTIQTKVLMSWDIASLAEEDALLFMWATNPFLEKAIELGRAWGFRYSTVAFYWHKGIHNPGRYTLSECEPCLVMKRGKIPQPRGARNIRQFVSSKRGMHSRKPDEIRKRITAMFPTQRKLEMFARNPYSSRPSEKWFFWGMDA